MRRPEQRFYDWLHRNKIIPGVYSRVENSVDVGTPDVEVTYCGHSGWIELKVGDPRTLTTRLLEIDQKVWHFRRAQHDGVVLVLVSWKKRVYIYRATASMDSERRYSWLGDFPYTSKLSIASRIFLELTCNDPLGKLKEEVDELSRTSSE